MIRHRLGIKIPFLIKELRQKIQGMPEPMSFVIIERFGQDPFLILVSCLLSLRTRDTVTLPVSLTLFEHIKTPQDIIDISLTKLEQSIYPVGFYKRKAEQLKKISALLLTEHGGQVPQTEQQLLALPGVGIKTANLVLGMAYNIPAICVDIHVHRISNRLGLVDTKTPEQTEQALKKVLPQKYWIEWNRLLVMWGQNVCKRTVECKLCNLAQLRRDKGTSSTGKSL
jgi:endonuclease III